MKINLRCHMQNTNFPYNNELYQKSNCLQEIWQYLSLPSSISKMIMMSEVKKPAISAVLDDVENILAKYEDSDYSTSEPSLRSHTNKIIGHMIKNVMKSASYKVYENNVDVSFSRYFKMASRYVSATFNNSVSFISNLEDIKSQKSNVVDNSYIETIIKECSREFMAFNRNKRLQRPLKKIFVSIMIDFFHNMSIAAQKIEVGQSLMDINSMSNIITANANIVNSSNKIYKPIDPANAMFSSVGIFGNIGTSLELLCANLKEINCKNKYKGKNEEISLFEGLSEQKFEESEFEKFLEHSSDKFFNANILNEDELNIYVNPILKQIKNIKKTIEKLFTGKTENFEQVVEDEWVNFSAKRENMFPNILVLGKTDSGKSSLINTIFSKEIATISNSKSKTSSFDEYYGKNHERFVNIIDSRGYELQKDTPESYFEEINKKVADMTKEAKNIHLVWYAISIQGTRIEDFDLNVLKKLISIEEIKQRICVVFTRCDENNEDGSIAKSFRDILSKEIESIRSFETSNRENLRLELDEMIAWSTEAIDDNDVRECFVASQTHNLEAKKAQAKKVTIAYCGSAAAIGESPVSFSDAALLVPLQLTMVVHITKIYGIDSMAKVSASSISGVVISQIGKTLAGSLLKLIPIVGSWVGGAINAAVASAITFALAMSINQICFNACKTILAGKEADFDTIFELDNIKQEFEKQFKKKIEETVKDQNKN